MRSGWRLATLGLIFVGLFGVLFFRLWFLQVAVGATYEEEAERQQVRVVASPAPRGEIRDARGELLAGSRTSLSVVVDPRLLPEDAAELDGVIQRLAALLGRAPVDVRAQFRSELERAPGQRFELAIDVEQQNAVFILEHAAQFPGVTVAPVPVRRYPEDDLASHVLGYVGKPSKEDLERKPDLRALDVVGKVGVEGHYDDFLRGTPGFTKYRVNASGEILSVLGEEAAHPGANLFLTVDARLQRVVTESLQQGIDTARGLQRPATRGAAVVLDARDGSVLAMTSLPDYRPELFVGGVPESEWERIQEQEALNNLAVQGQYPPASTFKAVTYLAAMEEGLFPSGAAAPDQPIFCDGELSFGFEEGSRQHFTDWKPGGHGPVDIHGALEQSCDIYFWQIALSVWRNHRDTDREAVVQEWARRLGFGSKSGIDLPAEQEGLVPDREWLETLQAQGSSRVRAEPGWVGGDIMNLVIGQGAMLATPLQLANGYAALVNGGTLWEPRVVDRIVGQDGETIFANPPGAIRELDIDPATTRAMRADLGRVVNGFAGTARVAFSGFGSGLHRVGGKTGTGEMPPKEDAAWFVGVAPLDEPRWVVAVVIEEGGSGGQVAAPVAKRVLQHLMGNAVDPVAPGQAGD